MANTITIKDCSNVSDDILIWLKKDQEGYLIERQINREYCPKCHFHIGRDFAEKIAEKPTDEAWLEMEGYVMRMC